MDNFFIHLAPSPRRFPHPAQIESIGHIAHKRCDVDRRFQTFNYSFILRGRGFYETQGRRWEIRAPCVITQWPDVHVRYGPERTWEELYVIYPPEALGHFQAAGLADARKPVWFIHDPAQTRRHLADLRDHIKQLDAFGSADALDRIAESMVLASRIAERKPEPDERTRVIRNIRAHVHEHYLEAIDFDQLALDYGISPATFRRHWARIVAVPPARYVTQLRIRQACRMLVESDASVGEIAESLSFEDPLYFSRKFKQVTGQTATLYRRQHEAPLVFSELD